MQTTRTFHFAKALVLASVLALLGACSSQDRHVFVSTHDLPTTVAVVNAYKNDQVYWIREIPVGYQLKLDLDRDGEFEFTKVTSNPPTSMEWTIKKSFEDNSDDSNSKEAKAKGYHTPKDEKTGKDPNEESDRMELPGTPVVMKVTFRQFNRENPPLNGKYTPSSEPNTGPVKSEK